MIGKHNPSELPCPDATWAGYEDVSPLAQRTGIPYTVLLDSRVRSLLERDVDPIEFERCNHQEPLTIYVLVALRFLLTRFPSMTRFRFSCGAGREAGSEKFRCWPRFIRTKSADTSSRCR